MKKLFMIVVVGWLEVMIRAQPTLWAQPIGTEVAHIAISQPYYADTSAMGAEAAYEWGFRNPAHLLTVLDYVDQGVFASGGHFFLNVGTTDADITSTTLAWVDKKSLPRLPYGLLAQVVYAEASGGARALPIFVQLGLRTRYVRFGGAIDLSQALVPGLSFGIIGALPVTESDLAIRVFGSEVLHSTEKHKLDLLFGFNWRGGEANWLALGAFANLVENDLLTKGIDLTTFKPLDLKETTSTQFVRLGIGARPAIPLDLPSDGSSPIAELTRNFLILTDVEYLGTAVPGEGAHQFTTGYFGVNARVLPDAWNPISSLLRFQGYGGVDTDGGWGAGVGLWPNEHGPLSWLTLDFSYNTRPIAPSFGSAVDTWSVNAAVTLPSPF